MNNSSPLPYDEKIFAVREQALGNELEYLNTLVTYYPGTLEIDTGAGHVFFDLMEILPFLSGYGEEKAVLCRRLTEIVYPLSERLLAQGVHLTVTISPERLNPPDRIESMATYAAFSIKDHRVHSCFLSPHFGNYDPIRLTIDGGMTVLCEPKNYRYHSLHEDRPARPRHGASNLPNRVNRSVDSKAEREKPAPYWYSGTPTDINQAGVKPLSAPMTAALKAVENFSQKISPSVPANLHDDVDRSAQEYRRHKLQIEKDHAPIPDKKPAPFVKLVRAIQAKADNQKKDMKPRPKFSAIMMGMSPFKKD